MAFDTQEVQFYELSLRFQFKVPFFVPLSDPRFISNPFRVVNLKLDETTSNANWYIKTYACVQICFIYNEWLLISVLRRTSSVSAISRQPE